MPRSAASVTQADIARVLRAVRQCGLEDWRVVVRDGAVYAEPMPAEVVEPWRAEPRHERTADVDPSAIIPL